MVYSTEMDVCAANAGGKSPLHISLSFWSPSESGAVVGALSPFCFGKLLWEGGTWVLGGNWNGIGYRGMLDRVGSTQGSLSANIPPRSQSWGSIGGRGMWLAVRGCLRTPLSPVSGSSMCAALEGRRVSETDSLIKVFMVLRMSGHGSRWARLRTTRPAGILWRLTGQEMGVAAYQSNQMRIRRLHEASVV